MTMSQASARPTYLVTGATGFAGQHLLACLAKLPASTRPRLALLLRDPSALASLGPLAKDSLLIEGSLEAPQQWQAAARALEPQGIFHLAALVAHDRSQAVAMHRVNVAGSVAIGELAKEVGARLVFLSSSGTVACTTSLTERPDEKAPFATATVRRWPYYLSKIEAERALRQLLPTGQQLIIVRPGMMLGPGDARYRSTRTVVRFLTGKVPFVLRGGIEVVDVRDVARALVRAMQLPEPAGVYHLPGHAATLEAYFAAIAQLVGRPPVRRTLPYVAAMGVAKASEVASRLFPRWLPHPVLDPVTVEMAHHYWGTSSIRAEQQLGHRARPLAETLQDTIDDLCARRADCCQGRARERAARLN